MGGRAHKKIIEIAFRYSAQTTQLPGPIVRWIKGARLAPCREASRARAGPGWGRRGVAQTRVASLS